ncbi:GNAT family N-acetyltransferase [Undibacterium sp. Di24W]|uniref:GNAT family N-acetyltransferase n=1 Tax=Undibacterium sp. Di24W TaxID=3413033 RepID=UPI003BF3A81C
MPNYAIRPATEEDSQELARLFTELGHPTTSAQILTHWPAWSHYGSQALVAAHVDGQLLGVITLHSMIVLHRPKPVGRVSALVVDARLRGSGVGRALMAAAERVLKDGGCGLIEITSNNRLVDAHAFYEHLGYTRTSIRLAKNLD